MSLTNKLEYIANEARENFSDRMWWRHRIGNRIISPVHLNVHPRRTGSTYVLDEDWDILVVLDGCRADLLEEVVDTNRFDSYRRILSPGSKTPEWAQQNFAGQNCGDIVYITSNGQVSKALDPTFHAMIEVWKETDGVPRPEDITEAAVAASQDYPDKRLVIHYLQPHRPFITSDERFSEGFTDNPWQALGNGTVNQETVWELYRENLRVVFDEAYELAEMLPGRAVLTSDHGNLMGERTWPIPIRLYGHPGGVRHLRLVEVPWGVIESEKRPEIRDGGIRSVGATDTNQVEKHLSELGYL